MFYTEACLICHVRDSDLDGSFRSSFPSHCSAPSVCSLHDLKGKFYLSRATCRFEWLLSWVGWQRFDSSSLYEGSDHHSIPTMNNGHSLSDKTYFVASWKGGSTRDIYLHQYILSMRPLCLSKEEFKPLVNKQVVLRNCPSLGLHQALLKWEVALESSWVCSYNTNNWNLNQYPRYQLFDLLLGITKSRSCWGSPAAALQRGTALKRYRWLLCKNGCARPRLHWCFLDKAKKFREISLEKDGAWSLQTQRNYIFSGWKSRRPVCLGKGSSGEVI